MPFNSITPVDIGAIIFFLVCVSTVLGLFRRSTPKPHPVENVVVVVCIIGACVAAVILNTNHLPTSPPTLAP